MARQGILVDVTKCTGCRGCQVACKQWNDLPATKTRFSGSYENPVTLDGANWTKVKFIETEKSGQVQFLFRKIQCMHCEQASCIAVCAAGAVSKMENGAVAIDNDKCIGCKNCIVACPFEAIGFDVETGTSKKCWGCQDRVENGLTPACVKTCPPGAITFGDREDLLALADVRVSELQREGKDAYIYGVNELGGLGNLYLLDARPEVYGLPVNPKPATASVFGNWLGVLAGVGAMAIAPFWMIFKDKDTEAAVKPGTGVEKDA